MTGPATLPPTAPSRQRLSDDFLDERRRERLLHGLATAIAASDYVSCHIKDIVKAAGCARLTFYRMFGSKAEAAHALLVQVSPELGVRFAGVDPARSPLGLLAVEVAAAWEAGEHEFASEQVATGDRVVRGLADLPLAELAPSDDALRCTLPPGRHGLSADFIQANQRQRLQAGLVAGIDATGFPGMTIKDVCDHAAVSRRTFYEHFDSVESAAAALVAFASDSAAELLDRVDLRSGLGGAAVELIAARMAAEPTGAKAKTAAVVDVLRLLDQVVREETHA